MDFSYQVRYLTFGKIVIYATYPDFAVFPTWFMDGHKKVVFFLSCSINIKLNTTKQFYTIYTFGI